MKRTLALPVFFLPLLTLLGQLSPGKLASPHEAYEGMSNCTVCHAIGSKTFPGCLKCHQVLQKKLETGSGFHANVADQNCSSCHSDHQGRDFAMVFWPRGQEFFNHEKKQTGFALEGKHAGLDCRACHQPRYVSEPLEGKDLERTFFGLDGSCLACHEDQHGAQLSANCQDCHNQESWKPASGFAHDTAGFVTTGAHKQAPCIACHPRRADRVLYKPVIHETCGDCHEDQHKGQFEVSCEKCHDTHAFTPARAFDHASSRFPLKGKHRQTTCKSCHPKQDDKVVIYSEVVHDTCADCHKDPHETRLGSDCSSCHRETGWTSPVATFNHELTRFSLKGKHATASCEGCHKLGLVIADFENCATCHVDTHAGQLDHWSEKGGCEACHNEKGFVPATFTLANHALRFPVEGAHLATPCFACHQPPDGSHIVAYHFEDTSCNGCHGDPHEGRANKYLSLTNGCTACHNTTSWQSSVFDHGATRFPLDGSHQNQTCSACHGADPDQPRFAGVGTECDACHLDVHQGQLALSKQSTDCARCHVTRDWFAEKFRHINSRFPLDGAHEGVACDACHLSDPADKLSTVRYKPLDLACASCHKSKKETRQ